MQCTEARRLLPAYLDGELDVINTVAVEQHLETCALCRQMVESEQTLKSAIKSEGLYFTAPSDLQARILRSLPQEKPVAGRRWKWAWPSYGFALAGAMLLVFAVFWSYRSNVVAQSDTLAEEVLSSHVRSLMAAHLFDVRSTDRHTVKPWFNGKIDYAPIVQDLTPQGYPLIGGRLDYLDKRPVAALVYRRQKHIINVYLWPATKAGDTPIQSVALRGYHLWHWTKAGMVYWVVSDLASSDLHDFASYIQNQPPGRN